MDFDIKKRKRELIKEGFRLVPAAKSGEKLVKISVLSILALRAALLIFEIIFSSVVGARVSLWSQLLLVPFILILYMIYDGNKGVIFISTLSAPVRILYHFSTVLPTVAENGKTLFTVATLAVLVAQLIISVFISASAKCGTYFGVMQKVNLKLRSEIINGKR